MKNLFFYILFLISVVVVAQSGAWNDSLKKNSVFISLGGKGLGSIGFDRKIFIREKFFLSGSVELGYAMPFGSDESIMIPVTLNCHLGKNKNKIVFGMSFGNCIDFRPFPHTKAERDQYIADGSACGTIILPPYKPYFIPSVGYERYFKNLNAVSFFFSPLIYSHYVPGKNNSCVSRPTLFPWGGVAFNFRTI